MSALVSGRSHKSGLATKFGITFCGTAVMLGRRDERIFCMNSDIKIIWSTCDYVCHKLKNLRNVPDRLLTSTRELIFVRKKWAPKRRTESSEVMKAAQPTVANL